MEDLGPLNAAIDDFISGASYKEAAQRHGITPNKLRTEVKKRGIKQARVDPGTGSTVDEFARRARSVLWRMDKGEHKRNYEKWKSRIEWLGSLDGGGLTKKQAIVRASKEWPALVRLMGEYELSAFETVDPGQHVKNSEEKPGGVDVIVEGVDLSYRDSMRWAADAAGAYVRDKSEPHRIPNDTCFYLYRQAIEEPKDFMAKMSQIESKVDKDEEARQGKRKEARMAKEEIEQYLDALELDDED